MRRLFATVIGCLLVTASATEPPLRIAAAASANKVIEALLVRYHAITGKQATVTLGASGLLARQITQGAPFDVFFSAQVALVDELIAKDIGVATSRTIAGQGRIVLWTKADGIQPPRGLADLGDPRFARIAIANPEQAPYGLAAQQALQASKQWESLRARLVFGDNVSQALQFAQTGNAEVAIVALSQALVAANGSWVLLDQSLHEPLDQALVVLTRTLQSSNADAFVALVTSPEGRAIMQRHGLLPPGETVDPALMRAANGRLAQ